jgi:carbonic anhydrase/acetyltransferase-like protein (isoleucine patch superfamily)
MAKRTFEDDPYFFNMPLSRHRNIFPMLRRGQPIIGYEINGNKNNAELSSSPESKSIPNKYDGDVFIAPCSTIIGAVRIGPDSSVWYGAILRADNCFNGMGHHSTPQDQIQWEQQCWINLSPEEKQIADQSYGGNRKQGGAIYIGRGTNVQDGAIITARKNHTLIGDYVTIGHAAQIHSARVESHTLIGMGAILCPGSHVERFSFVAAGAVVKENTTVKSGELWVGNPARKIRDLSDKERQKLIYQADEYVKLSKTQMDVMQLGGNVPAVVAVEPTQYIEANNTTTSEIK